MTMTRAGPFLWTSAARSHVGLVRATNEDACLDLPERGLWAVADGMGGHAVGDYASGVVIESLTCIPPPQSLETFIAGARAGLEAANRRLREEAALRDVRIIGSTVVVLLAQDRHCGCLWAGDSRIYLCRDGAVQLLTRDHSQVEELKSRGRVSAEEALHHPARNLITRAVGATDRLDLDEEIVEVRDGDIFLLCSDGLSNHVSEQEMGVALLRGDCRQAADALIDLALEAGGRDNISAVVVHADDPLFSDRTLLNPAV